MTALLEPAYLDDLNRPVYDRTEEYQQRFADDALKAEQCEQNLLVLFKIDKGYMLIYKWLRDPEDMATVVGSDTSYWPRREVALDKPLFEQFRLFP